MWQHHVNMYQSMVCVQEFCLQTPAFPTTTVIPSALVAPEPIALLAEPNLADQHTPWQTYLDYFLVSVHTKAQKYHNDLQALLDTTTVMTVVERCEQPNAWPPQAKHCKWMKKHMSKIQCKADQAFSCNDEKLFKTLRRRDFCKCPHSWIKVVEWLLDKAKQRSLEMYLRFCHLTEISEDNYKLSIVVDYCNGLTVEFEALTILDDFDHKATLQCRLPLSAPRRRQSLGFHQLVYSRTSVGPHLQQYHIGWVAWEAVVHRARAASCRHDGHSPQA